MSRINKLENIYKEKLKHHKIKDTSRFIQYILDADVTKGKYARFLIEAFLNDKFLEEDLIGRLNSTVGQAISLFDKHKSKLPLEHRSIYAFNPETGEALYQSPGDLWNNVKQFQGKLSGKELKREEQEKVYRETEFVYKDEETGFQIISPLTEDSAKWWGKGTRWCTSADNNNMFKRYSEKSPLFILLMPDKQKLQLWKNGNNIQFMNEADNIVSLDYIEQNWSVLEPVCLWLNDLRFIPEHLKTKELCELTVKQNGMSLLFVPKNFKTIELCQIAIANNGSLLRYIPYELRTEELCKLSVSNNEEALKYVPEEYRTKELCELAVQQNGQYGWALDCVPKELKTPELYELAVSNNKKALYFVPEDMKTYKVCELSIRKGGGGLHCVPEEHKTKELCEIAIKKNKEFLQFVPDKFITLELCKIAVKNNKMSFWAVPHKYRTKELRELFEKRNDDILLDIQNKFKDIFQEIKTLFPKNDVSSSYCS